SKIARCNTPSRHPKWREVNLSAEMPGWTRFKPAAEWLASHRTGAVATAAPGGAVDQASPELKAAFERFMQNYSRRPLSGQEQEQLFAKFVKLLAATKAEQAAR